MRACHARSLAHFDPILGSSFIASMAHHDVHTLSSHLHQRCSKVFITLVRFTLRHQCSYPRGTYEELPLATEVTTKSPSDLGCVNGQTPMSLSFALPVNPERCQNSALPEYHSALSLSHSLSHSRVMKNIFFNNRAPEMKGMCAEMIRRSSNQIKNF